MSDRPIQQGDLVMIVRPTECCGSDSVIGKIRTVTDEVPKPTIICNRCGLRWNTGDYGPVVILSNGKSCLVSRLKRLDPDALSEDVPAHDEVTI